MPRNPSAWLTSPLFGCSNLGDLEVGRHHLQLPSAATLASSGEPRAVDDACEAPAQAAEMVQYILREVYSQYVYSHQRVKISGVTRKDLK